MIDCPFCKIVAGQVETHVVFEDATCLGFLDHRPLFAGHVLLVPRHHAETLVDLPPASVTPLFMAARLLSAAVPAALDAEGTFVAMNQRVSQSVPHLHVHIVPRRRRDGLRGFFWPRHPYADQDQARDVAERIRRAVVAAQRLAVPGGDSTGAPDRRPDR